MGRTGEKVFGILAILVGIGVVIGALAGVEFEPLVLALISVVVIGWVTYYWVVVRPAPTGVERPEQSTHHEDI